MSKSYKDMLALLEKAAQDPENAKRLVEDNSDRPPMPKHIRNTGMPPLKRVWATTGKDKRGSSSRKRSKL